MLTGRFLPRRTRTQPGLQDGVTLQGGVIGLPGPFDAVVFDGDRVSAPEPLALLGGKAGDDRGRNEPRSHLWTGGENSWVQSGQGVRSQSGDELSGLVADGRRP
jgi:hypothetical protein